VTESETMKQMQDKALKEVALLVVRTSVLLSAVPLGNG
jgi:hypothetical protein